ncbi:MAG: protein kinase [Planctomycetales bacterium]|nr:protein kinase [Planctomycetales bacterium]
MSPSQQEQLAELLDHYLMEMEHGIVPAADEIAARHPELARPLTAYLRSLEILHQAAHRDVVSDITETLGSKASSSSLIGPVVGHANDDSGESSASSPILRRLGDYRLIRQVGRGGMGVVYEAVEESLHRRVALKVLPFAAVLDQIQIARFRNEAQAAAQLHHPHIVPVFSVGCERGVHYYAMQFINGQSIDQAIAELRKRSPVSMLNGERRQVGDTAADNVLPATGIGERPSLPGDPFGAADQPSTQPQPAFSTVRSHRAQSYVRTAAEIARQIALGLQHAHSLGIIHRDIKPSNLLLDEGGRPWITDFGLARFRADQALTRTGDVVGTLRYMSPEQARGDSSWVDHRSDIYSLGITLYELLTLQEALRIDESRDFLHRIETEEPVAPRRLNPAIPVDLETIVLKASAKDPVQRYPSAQELADDLTRFLEGSPIRARRPTVWERMGRWGKRHRRLVGASAAIVLVALCSLTVATVMFAREKQKTDQALTQSHIDFVRAERALLRQYEIVDRSVERTASRLADLPGAESLRRELLADLMGYYRSFIDESASANSTSLISALALTHFKAGSIAERLGDNELALDDYRQAQRRYRQLLDRRPLDELPPGLRADQLRYHAELALSQNNEGWLLARLGDVAGATVALEAALERQQMLVAADDSPEYVTDLARTQMNLGQLAEEQGSHALARERFTQAMQSLAPLVEQPPTADVRTPHEVLAACYHNLAHLLADDDLASAEEYCQRAHELLWQLLDFVPDSLRYRRDLALGLNNAGALQSRQEKWELAVRSHQSAVELGEELVRLAPRRVDLQRDLAISQNNLGRAFLQTGALETADLAFTRAEQIVRYLVERDPAEPAFQGSLGGILSNRALTLQQLGKSSAAIAAIEEAVTHQREAWTIAPQVTRYREFLTAHLSTASELLRSDGRFAESVRMASLRTACWPDDPQELMVQAEEICLAIDGLRDLQLEGNGDPHEWTAQALTCIERSLERGYQPPADLAGNPRLQALATDARFHELIDRFRAASEPAATRDPAAATSVTPSDGSTENAPTPSEAHVPEGESSAT